MKFVFTLIGILVLLASRLTAQEVVAPLHYNPYQAKKETKNDKAVFKTTALSLPFFDDFTGQYPQPDNSKWEDKWQVYVNSTMGIEPVSRGVATFDALNKDGIPYSPKVNTALVYADSLTSLAIDLNSYTAANNIYLSFYYQPQGNGFAPEEQDSLLLFFLTRSTGWVNVWAKEGRTSHPFTAVSIPVLDTGYLHAGFQFRFVNKASINVNDDVWNIDYVKMDVNRSAGDTLTNDVAISKAPTSFLGDYTFMPYHQYLANAANERANDVKTTVYNGYNVLQNVNYAMSAIEKDSGTPLFSGGNGSITCITGQPQEITFPTYSNSVPLQENHKYVEFQNKYYVAPVSPSEPHDNDTFTQRQIFHNFFAYDDGTAEKSYFLNLFATLPGKTAVEYNLNVPDTMSGVAIYFGRQVPMGYYKSFSVAVYHSIDFAGPDDSVIYLQELLDPGYLYVDHYYVYKFDKPVAMNAGKFFVGAVQPALGGSDSLYFGLDVNRLQSNHLFFNVKGYWEPSTVQGAIMIRPIFGPIIASGIPGEHKRSFPTPEWSVFPNPAQDRIQVKLSNAGACTYEILDIQGRLIEQQTLAPNAIVDIADLNAGMYFMRIVQDGIKSSPKRIIKL